jgi:hypothetical protein
MKKRQSIKSTYDSAKDGYQYFVSTSVNHKPVSSQDIADPFVTQTVKVSLLDTLKGLFMGGVNVQVRVNPKNNRIVEDVMELDDQYLGLGANTRRDEFEKQIFDSAIEAMDRDENVPKKPGAN